jgi:23S rRNA pseudouridine1911/1915/1917 synthase
MNDPDLLFVTEEETTLRLDKVLKLRFPEYSRTYFQSLIEKNLVLVNGSIPKKSEKLKVGDEIEVEFAVTTEISIQPEPIPLDIIYEDAYLLAINKPAGMVVHPAVGNWTGTFVNALLYHCEKSSSDTLRPGIVHRLDKETSGVLIAAKNEMIQRKLVEAFAERQVQKEYRAICLGNPGSKRIEENVGRHPIKRKEMTTLQEGGKAALTLCETLSFNQGLSYVKLLPFTGRTHQLRVHMRHIHCPILGDPIYGNNSANKKWNIYRQMLHAFRLSLIHPATHQKIELTAPLPEDMQRLIKLI